MLRQELPENGGLAASEPSVSITMTYIREARGAVVVLLLVILLPLTANAHSGPPIPIFERQVVGPCVISLWAHPTLGAGTFFVLVNPAAGSQIPRDLKIEIGIRPENGRLPEVLYPVNRDSSRGQTEYKALVQFDREESWRVRLVLQSSQGGGEILSRVDVTPHGFGRWDLLLYLLPFLAVAFLLFWGILRKRGAKGAKLQAA